MYTVPGMPDPEPSPRRPPVADGAPRSRDRLISPALREPVRSLAQVIRDLQSRLPGVDDPAERQRIERSLGVLRDVLARHGERD